MPGYNTASQHDGGGQLTYPDKRQKQEVHFRVVDSFEHRNHFRESKIF